MIVAIAGADGAGKTTMSQVLVRTLRGDGIDAICLDRFAILERERYPAASFIVTDVQRLRGHVLAMPPVPRLLFLLWSMSLTLAESPHEAGRGSTVIIYDSYWMKHVAAEIVYGADERAALAAAALLPQADLTVYLKLSPEESLERKRDSLVAYECGLDASCSPESFLRHQQRIQELLDVWAQRFGWLQLDGRESVDSTVKHLSAVLRPRLSWLGRRDG